MNTTSAQAAPLSRIYPSRTFAGTLAIAALLVALQAASAHVRIPIPGTPIPFTLQTFFVVLSGALLGARFAPAAQGAYLALGAAGLPVFATGAGFAYLFGPTGGYLFGFVMGALSVGRLVQAGAGRSFGRTFAAMLFGSLVIVGMGSLYLSLFYGGDFFGGLAQGAVPFFGGAVVKSAAAAAVFHGLDRRQRARR